MGAAQVVNFRAAEQIALRVKEQKQSQLSSLILRIESHRRSVDRPVDAAGAIDYFKVNRHTWPRFKLIADPEPAALRAGSALGYGVVDLCFETGALNWDKAFRLSRGTGADGYSDSDSKDNLY